MSELGSNPQVFYAELGALDYICEKTKTTGKNWIVENQKKKKKVVRITLLFLKIDINGFLKVTCLSDTDIGVIKTCTIIQKY